MEIKFYSDPAPHYIIDDFLNPRAAKEILNECIDLEPFYQQAKITGDGTHAPHPGECKLCKKNFDKFRNTIRDNQTIYLDELYKDKREDSKSLEHLHSIITSEHFKKFAENSEHMFPILNYINTSESMISRYGKCDFYGWHRDESIPGPKRVITISYYINKEPLTFDGGDLLMLYSDGIKYKEIKPKHNRAVIFTSSAYHSVQYVNLTGKKWEEGRFSIQFWLGFNPDKHRFR